MDNNKYVVTEIDTLTLPPVFFQQRNSRENYNMQGSMRMILWRNNEVEKLIEFLNKTEIFEEIKRNWENKL